MALTKPSGRWRYEDLFDLPEGHRYEIIDGELFEMPGPLPDHALAVMNLIVHLLPVVTAMGGQLLTAPLDVFLPGADPVQPDLLVLLPNGSACIGRRGVEGPPALVVEVLSPSNPAHDRVRKRALYARAGVLEYWLVSPEAGSIEVLVLDGPLYRTHARVAGDEVLTSLLFPDLGFPAAALFTSALA